MNEDRETAYHEAGHAILAWQFGFPVKRVTLNRPGSQYAGVCELHAWSVDAMRDPLRALMYLHAGTAAVSRLMGKATPGCDAGDRAQAAALATLVCEETPGCTEAAIVESAQLIVRALMDHPLTWKAIERTAHELLRKRSLSGRDVQVIFREVTE